MRCAPCGAYGANQFRITIGRMETIDFVVILCRKQQFLAYADFLRSHAWSLARETRSGPHPHQYAEGIFDLG